MRAQTLGAGVIALAVVLFAARGDAATPTTRTSSTTRGAVESASEDEVDEADEDAPPEDERDEPAPRRRRRARDEGPRYRHERGSVSVSAVLGFSKDDRGTRFAGGLGLGYAVVTGVVPGVRGLLATMNGEIGGEVAMTLTLTPPISLTAVPFALAEVGRRYDPGIDAWLYGAGVGLYLGHPAESGSALQLGWMWRRIAWSDGSTDDVQGPIISLVWDH